MCCSSCHGFMRSCSHPATASGNRRWHMRHRGVVHWTVSHRHTSQGPSYWTRPFLRVPDSRGVSPPMDLSPLLQSLAAVPPLTEVYARLDARAHVTLGLI